MEPSYEIDLDLGVVDENKNTTIEVKLIRWNGAKEARLDIRKWYPNQDKMGKGLAFFTNQGVTNLVTTLIEHGMVSEEAILNALSNVSQTRKKIDPIVELKDDEAAKKLLSQRQLEEYEKQFFMYDMK